MAHNNPTSRTAKFIIRKLIFIHFKLRFIFMCNTILILVECFIAKFYYSLIWNVINAINHDIETQIYKPNRNL